MSNLTDKMINTARLTELHRAAELQRRAQEEDVVRKPGLRLIAARQLRRLADRLDNGRRQGAAGLYGRIGSN